MKLLTKKKLFKFFAVNIPDFSEEMFNNLPKIRYDRAGYKKGILETKKDFPDTPIWYENRTDPKPFFVADKNYIVLWSFASWQFTESQTVVYNKMKEVWEKFINREIVA